MNVLVPDVDAYNFLLHTTYGVTALAPESGAPVDVALRSVSPRALSVRIHPALMLRWRAGAIAPGRQVRVAFLPINHQRPVARLSFSDIDPETHHAYPRDCILRCLYQETACKVVAGNPDTDTGIAVPFAKRCDENPADLLRQTAETVFQHGGYWLLHEHRLRGVQDKAAVVRTVIGGILNTPRVRTYLDEKGWSRGAMITVSIALWEFLSRSTAEVPTMLFSKLYLDPTQRVSAARFERQYDADTWCWHYILAQIKPF